MSYEWRRDPYVISTDPNRLQREVIYDFLRTTYWSPGVPREVVERAIDHSCAFGLYDGEQQIGFARVITDYATMGYLADVFVLEPYRGQGLGQWLVEVVLSHPELQGFRRWLLATRDAHELYRKAGFVELRAPERWMERWDPEVYTRGG